MEEISGTSNSGKVIAGRYEVIRTLGRGGIGKVFLCHDRKHNRQVALKMLRTKYKDNERAAERFAREVMLVRQLNHPCIVKIYDARRDNDTLFYTMEYVEGKTVRQWMKERGQLEFGSVVRVLSLIAHALEHAHTVTIHRDISPENVMVLHDGMVRLLDFGLAKLNDPSQAMTMIGASLGKLAYVAPEQRMNAAKVDRRADIYPLGVMFFEMLTGKLPQPGLSFGKLRPDLPKSCEAFLERAMAQDPEKRFANATEYREALAVIYNDYKAAEEKARPATPLPSRSVSGANDRHEEISSKAVATGFWGRLRTLLHGLLSKGRR